MQTEQTTIDISKSSIQELQQYLVSSAISLAELESAKVDVINQIRIIKQFIIQRQQENKPVRHEFNLPKLKKIQLPKLNEQKKSDNQSNQ